MAFKSLSALTFIAVVVQAQTFQPLRFAGVNIAGFDFGCGTDGTCNITRACPPLTQLGCADGLGQMQHFVENDGYNVFRLPVGWQYLTHSQMTGVPNQTQFANYNMLVDACLSTGAYCEIDIHNYAQYDGAAANEVFAELWCNIADYWKNEARIIFGVMNEPHDIPDIVTWAGSVHAAVTAIRSTGATSQIILLPGNNYTPAQTFVSGGSAAALNMYLDYDNSETHVQCATNNIESSWYPLVTWFHEYGRHALNTEIGGGDVDSCVGYLSQQIGYQAANSDVILGYIGWGAGSLTTDYILSETPYVLQWYWLERHPDCLDDTATHDEHACCLRCMTERR